MAKTILHFGKSWQLDHKFTEIVTFIFPIVLGYPERKINNYKIKTYAHPKCKYGTWRGEPAVPTQCPVPESAPLS